MSELGKSVTEEKVVQAAKDGLTTSGYPLIRQWYFRFADGVPAMRHQLREFRKFSENRYQRVLIVVEDFVLIGPEFITARVRKIWREESNALHEIRNGQTFVVETVTNRCYRISEKDAGVEQIQNLHSCGL